MRNEGRTGIGGRDADKIQKIISKGIADITARIGELRSEGKTRMLAAKGRKTVRELDRNSRAAVILQHKLLAELLEENKDTEFGRKYHFADIHTAEEFKEKVPLSFYEDYALAISRMMKGEQGILSARQPVYFAMTSGSVGVPKYIPVSREELEKYNKYSVEMAFGVADEYYRNTTGKGVPAGPGLNAIEARVKETNTGAMQGAISGGVMRSVRSLVPFLLSTPWEVISAEGGEETDMKYLKARFALAEANLSFMDSVFITGLVDLMDYILEHYELLCRDICFGKISEEVKVPARIREMLAPQLKPDRRRTYELMREFRADTDMPIIPRIWPRMSWIGGIGTGGFLSYSKRMRKYAGKSIPFNNLCYAASESFMAVARHMGDESYVLLPESGFYEFIPARGGDDERTYNIDELEVGEDYEIVITNLSGLYRYRIRDVIRVTGYYNETPLVRFIYRKNQLVSIAGEKTNEESLRWTVEEFSRESGVEVVDYSVYEDTATAPGRYVILIEPVRAVRKGEIPGLRELMESTLMRANPAYGEMVMNGTLSPLKLVILQQQTYLLYRDMMIAKGASANQLKPVRLIDTPFKEQFFFALRENYDE